VKSSTNEGTPDSAASDAQRLTNLIESEAFRSQGLRSLDVPRQWVVLAAVLGERHNDEIRNRVVGTVVVPMVYMFPRGKLTLEKLFHDKAVLLNLLTVDAKGSIPPASEVANALVRATAGIVAESPGVSAEGTALADSSSTVGAGALGTQTPMIGVTAGEAAEAELTALNVARASME
jgi:hypothetical protein